MIEDKTYKVNQKFTLTFILEVNGENMVQETKIRLPDFSKFNRIGSGSEQKTLFTEDDAINQIVYQQVLSPKFAGKLKIGSALVTVNGKIYKTEPFEIFVEEEDKKSVADTSLKTKDNVYLNLEIDDREVYQNEPTIAVLRAYSKNLNNFRKIKNIRLPAQENVEYSTVNYNKTDIEFSKTSAPSQILGIFLIFAEKGGNVQLQPISANYSVDLKKIVSNKVNIKIKNLPENAPLDFKNAVGDFKINFTTDSEDKVEINKPVNLRLTISGEGNMQNIQLPVIKNSELYDVFQPKIIKDIAVGEKGISGKIIADYILVPKKAGAISIVTDAFSFFNPEDKEYTDLGAQEVTLNVVSQEEILSARTPIERVNAYTNNVLESVDNPMVATKKLKIKQSDKINWNTSLLNFLLFCSIIGIAILINNYRKKKKKNIDNLKTNNTFSAPINSEKMTDSDLENTFGYLRRMLREKDFSQVFSTIAALDSNFKIVYNTPSNSNFSEVLENIKGSKTAEEYRNLSQKIQIERFSPVTNEEEVEEIVHAAIKFYSNIAK